MTTTRAANPKPLDRNVVDKTGLTGNYDVALKWTPDERRSADDAGPSIFTALEEQLGPERPLSWNDFSGDLIVASHFSHVVGVYNLEGVVRLGFLYRLETMDWHQSATISAQSITRARRLQWVTRILL
ncbi:MAG TPA: TIGR03435 family protein [Terracidiphilus sp.]|jgi:hypothetical protein